MKKEEKVTNFWKYALLVVGGILILVPLLVTVFSRSEDRLVGK